MKQSLKTKSRLHASQAFWRTYLAEPEPKLGLLPDWRAEPGQSKNASASVELSATAVEHLERMAPGSMDGKFLVLFSGLLLVLRKYMGGEPVAVAVPGRKCPLPILFRAGSETGFKQVLFAVQDNLARVHAHEAGLPNELGFEPQILVSCREVHG